MVRWLLVTALLLTGCSVPLNAPGRLELSVSDYPNVIRAGDTLRILIEVKSPESDLELNVSAPEDLNVTEQLGQSFVNLTIASSASSSGFKQVSVELISSNKVGVATIGFDVVPEEE